MVGTRRLKASDPEEQRLRDAFYAAPEGSQERRDVADLLAAYIWNRVSREVEADRKKHPKAKRNLPVGHEGAGGGGRYLP